MEEPKRVENLSYHLSIIPDPRVERRKVHSLHDVLMIAILGMLCGAESFVDFEDFDKAKEGWLRGFLALPNGIPSHDTFGRVFAAMNNQLFAESFRNWTEGLRKKISGEIVAIDGKTLRRSNHKNEAKSAIHMVSAWGGRTGWFSDRSRSKRRAMKSRPSPNCCEHWSSRSASSLLMPWARRSRSPARSGTPMPTAFLARKGKQKNAS